MLYSFEAARSRFEPGYRLASDVTVLFKTHIIFFFYVLRRQVNVCSAHSANSGLELSTEQTSLQVCGDRITEWMSGGQQSN